MIEGGVNAKKIISSVTKLDIPRYTAWVLYDIANTFYASGVLTFLSLTWILVIGQQNGFNYIEANLIYHNVIAFASIFMAIMLPILGSLSDVTQQRKNYVIFFTIVCLISTASFLFFNNFWIILIVFSISLITYQWAQVFYDTMLPGIVPVGREARLSSIAITLGYIGGAVITGIGFFLSQKYDAPNADISQGVITLGYSKLMIIAVIIGFALLSLPLIFVKEINWKEVNKLGSLNKTNTADQNSHPDINNEIDSNPILSIPEPVLQIAKKSFGDLFDTLRDIHQNNRGMFFYIIAYFIIADIANLMGIITVTYLRDSINLSENDIFLIIAISGLSLIIFTYPLGRIIDRKGAKAGFQIIGILWSGAFAILILEGIVFPQYFIFVAAVLLGPALSGVWISQRQMVLELVPNEKSIGRYFGLTKFSGKLSSALGPIIFSSTLYVFENHFGTSLQIAYRCAIFALGVFLVIGFIILQLKVPNNHNEFLQRKQRLLQVLLDADTGMNLTELA